MGKKGGEAVQDDRMQDDIVFRVTILDSCAAQHLAPICTGYLSAICHDLDHKGMNNDFLIKTSNPLAIQYNDLSPLENHHLAQSFRLLNRDDCGLFRHLSKDRQVSSTVALAYVQYFVLSWFKEQEGQGGHVRMVSTE